MDYKDMCIQQGYVPPTCKMDGQMCWLLIKEGKDPCDSCNYNRAICNGRHAPYENESYKFGVFLDSLSNAEHNRRIEIEAEKRRKKTERQEKHSRCNAKVILTIDTDVSNRKGLVIEVKVNDLINERGYVKRFKNIYETANRIPAIISKYGVGQVQIDSNGCGLGIFDAIENLHLNIDVIPIVYTRIVLDY